MGKVKRKKSGILKAAVSAVSPRAGKALELAGRLGGGRGKVAGRGNLGVSRARRPSKGVNVNKYLKQVMKAKMNAKLLGIKLKTINAIK
jgi:hypothetical protein